jgi:hypothetical protein
MDASFSTTDRIGRTIFSNILTKQSMINNGSYNSAAKLTTGGGGSNAVNLFQSTGEVATSPTEFNTILGFSQQPPPSSVKNGSLFFSSTPANYGYLTIPNSPDFSFGTGDFTIEWFQYLQNPNDYPRIFSLGTAPNASIAVSIESGVFYLWLGGAPYIDVEVSTTDTWTHFAVVRYSGSITVYKNGVPIAAPLSYSTAINNNTSTFVVGNESTPTLASAYTGYLSSFRIIKGDAFYRTNFSPPNSALERVSGTVLLLLVKNPTHLVMDSSGTNKFASNTNLTFSAVAPF